MNRIIFHLIFIVLYTVSMAYVDSYKTDQVFAMVIGALIGATWMFTTLYVLIKEHENNIESITQKTTG